MTTTTAPEVKTKTVYASQACVNRLLFLHEQYQNHLTTLGREVYSFFQNPWPLSMAEMEGPISLDIEITRIPGCYNDDTNSMFTECAVRILNMSTLQA